MLIEVLKRIRLNPLTGLYQAIEAGYKYQFSESMLQSLKKHLDNDPTRLIGDWYRGLSESERSLVKRSMAFEK